MRTGREPSYPEPGELHLGQPALARDAVHDLQVLRLARARSSQSATRCLFDVADVTERGA